MALLRVDEIRKMDAKAMAKRLAEFRLELAKIRGNTSMGASAQSPGRISELKRAIARIKTMETENSNKAASVAKEKPKEKPKAVKGDGPGEK